MAVECDAQRERFVLTRIRYRLTNDLLMTKVHAVEETNRQANPASGPAQLTQVVNGFHCVGKGLLSRTKKANPAVLRASIVLPDLA